MVWPYLERKLARGVLLIQGLEIRKTLVLAKLFDVGRIKRLWSKHLASFTNPSGIITAVLNSNQWKREAVKGATLHEVSSEVIFVHTMHDNYDLGAHRIVQPRKTLYVERAVHLRQPILVVRVSQLDGVVDNQEVGISSGHRTQDS